MISSFNSIIDLNTSTIILLLQFIDAAVVCENFVWIMDQLSFWNLHVRLLTWIAHRIIVRINDLNSFLSHGVAFRIYCCCFFEHDYPRMIGHIPWTGLVSWNASETLRYAPHSTSPDSKRYERNSGFQHDKYNFVCMDQLWRTVWNEVRKCYRILSGSKQKKGLI